MPANECDQLCTLVTALRADLDSYEGMTAWSLYHYTKGMIDGVCRAAALTCSKADLARIETAARRSWVY